MAPKKKDTVPAPEAATAAVEKEAPAKKTTAAKVKKEAAAAAAAPAAEEKEKEKAAPAPKAKKAAGKKTARADDGDDEALTSPTTASKLLRRESSTGAECSLMPATKDLENLTQEECEKDTVPFDYAACLKANNSTVFPPETHYKIITWNVAGLRALIKAGYAKSELKTLVEGEQPDVLCLQETKLSDPNEPLPDAVLKGYTFVETLSTAKLGYAGTRTYIKDGLFDLEKSKHFNGFDIVKNPKCLDDEGRVVASFLVPAEANATPLTIVNNYVPNSGMKLERLDYRVADYDRLMRDFLTNQIPAVEKTVYAGLTTESQLVWLGDLNVAVTNFDRFHNGNYKTMQKTPGYTPPERASFRKTMESAKLVDSFRHFYPNHRGAYTFYSRMFNQRAKGNGWRLDYFAVSAAMISGGRAVGVSILEQFKGSDHIPSVLYLKKK